VRRFLKIAALALAVLLVLLGVNAYVLNQETKPAEVNAPGGELTADISEDQPLDLQYVDHPATGGGPEGEPIVLLHCYTCSLRWWDQMVPLLNDGHRVITFDLLGHGGSEKPTSGYEIENQAAAVAAALNGLGVTSATVVGHSLGGLVATSLREQASDLVDKVVVVDSPASSGQADLPLTAKIATWPVLGEALWRVKLGSMIKRSAERDFAPGTDVSEVFPDQPDRVVDDVDAMTYRSFSESASAADDFLDHGGLPSRLRAVGGAVMVIMGSEDQILDPDEVLGQFEVVPGVRAVTIEGAGHSPNVERPEETAEQIISFVGDAPLVAPEEPPGSGGGGNDQGGKGGKKDDESGKGGKRDGGGKG